MNRLENPQWTDQGKGWDEIWNSRTLKTTWLQDMVLFIFCSSRHPSAPQPETPRRKEQQMHQDQPPDLFLFQIKVN